MRVSWFSAGVSSAVATKLSCPDRIIYIDIEDQHVDTMRFLHDCERWFGQKIEILRSPLGSVENACRVASYLVGPGGAACTSRLKIRVRKEWEALNVGSHEYVWGFDSNERKRAEAVERKMRDHSHIFPILNRTKSEVHGILSAAGISRPRMYDLGYHNNNCVGCLRGGIAYWVKIRKDFPEVFARRVALERLIGAHICTRRVKVAGKWVHVPLYLDKLRENDGRGQSPIVPDCGIFCELQIIP